MNTAENLIRRIQKHYPKAYLTFLISTYYRGTSEFDINTMKNEFKNESQSFCAE